MPLMLNNKVRATLCKSKRRENKFTLTIRDGALQECSRTKDLLLSNSRPARRAAELSALPQLIVSRYQIELIFLSAKNEGAVIKFLKDMSIKTEVIDK